MTLEKKARAKALLEQAAEQAARALEEQGKFGQRHQCLPEPEPPPVGKKRRPKKPSGRPLSGA